MRPPPSAPFLCPSHGAQGDTVVNNKTGLLLPWPCWRRLRPRDPRPGKEGFQPLSPEAAVLPQPVNARDSVSRD